MKLIHLPSDTECLEDVLDGAKPALKSATWVIVIADDMASEMLMLRRSSNLSLNDVAAELNRAMVGLGADVFEDC